ncbi:unnamed protein product [Vitrella brassicaformis CCMP3155]|uniref:Aurora kinase n=1 Tax=Vitrella brassicaformis (strain CCMP3155) TaxID=1169540 RepID=A0A0G4EUA4_VITBC|nr:unnamed protein product [Vitrella brassicaformis CCMP3155]|eukprot:CEM01868.1 unnamed protein product [Vitrella brassicaformis CCMP3155]
MLPPLAPRQKASLSPSSVGTQESNTTDVVDAASPASSKPPLPTRQQQKKPPSASRPPLPATAKQGESASPSTSAPSAAAAEAAVVPRQPRISALPTRVPLCKALGGARLSNAPPQRKPRRSASQPPAEPSISTSQPAGGDVRAADVRRKDVIPRPTRRPTLAPRSATPGPFSQRTVAVKEPRQNQVVRKKRDASVGPKVRPSAVRSPSVPPERVEEGPKRRGREAGDGGAGEKGGDSGVFSLSAFEMGRPLGKGRFGCVYLARHRPTGQMVALKVMHRSMVLGESFVHQIRREVEIQARLRHPHVLRLHGFFRDQQRLYLVLEYAAKGPLFNKLKQQGRLSEAETAKYAAQLALGLQFLHSRGILHRDLKPENLLITEDDTLKIADFGWAVLAPREKRRTLCGTADYLAPEVVERRAYDTKVDVWCFGVTVYELLTGEPPFKSHSQESMYALIRQCSLRLPSDLSDDVKDLLSKVLTQPVNRISIDQVLDHPWIRRALPPAHQPSPPPPPRPPPTPALEPAPHPVVPPIQQRLPPQPSMITKKKGDTAEARDGSGGGGGGDGVTDG